MAPPRKHSTDDILDAAREVVLAEGSRAASVAAISEACGAPVGTLYHRFGSRDRILTAAWLRALERFQQEALDAYAAHPADPVEAGVAMAAATIAFATHQPQDANLLLAVRRSDLLDATPDEGLSAALEQINAPLRGALVQIARALHGRADARAVEAVTRAVVDLPGAALRRHARDGSHPPPRWLGDSVADATRTLLRQPGGGGSP